MARKVMAGCKVCNRCGGKTGCIDTRRLLDGRIRRRYKCNNKKCGTRHSTLEMRVPAASKGLHAQSLDALIMDKARKEWQEKVKALGLGFNIIEPPKFKRKPGRPRKDGVDIDAAHKR